jgi:phosphate transport system substrate-binding protein
MRISARASRMLVASIAALTLSATIACGGGDSSSGDDGGTAGDALSGTIVIDGSSTVGPIAEAAAEEFGKEHDVQVTVGISGTSGGFEKFCRGEADISDASRPIRTTETQVCADAGIELTEFKVAVDGLTVAVHKDNTWARCLTFTQLRAIFGPGSTASSWKDVDPSFPDEPLAIFSPGADSGTFDYFTEEVNGELDASRSDSRVTFSEDDNVLVQGVAQDRGAIGYFGYAYYLGNADRLSAVQLDRDVDRAGQPVTMRAGCIAAEESTVLAGTYPLARPLYMYAANESLESKPQVGAFIEFVLTNPQLIADVGYIKLPESDYALNLAKLEATTD